MSAWSGMPWMAAMSMGLLGAAATIAALPIAHQRGRMGGIAWTAARICTLLTLGIALLAKSSRATLGGYLDVYYVVLAWMLAAATLITAERVPGRAPKSRWRALVIVWAMLGSFMWVGAAYFGNRAGMFLAGLLVMLVLLVGCHLWLRLPAAGIVLVNTLILGIVGLPVVDLAVRFAASLRAPPQAGKQFYLYAVAHKDPPAFGRWWNYYVAEWRQAEKRIYAPDPDPVLTYRLRPNASARVIQSSFSINSHGFRGREIMTDTTNTYRIVALGESTTFGVTLQARDRPWPELLEQLIRDRLKPPVPVEVINAGVPGYRLDQNLHRFPKEIVPLRPDLVISYHGVNGFGALREAVPLTPGAAPPAYKDRPLRLLADAEYRLKLLRFQHRPAPKRPPRSQELADPCSTRYARLYRELIQLAQTNGIRLALANYSMAANDQTAPEVVEFCQVGYPAAPWNIAANRVHSAIIQQLALEHRDVCLVDTHPDLDGQHDKFIDLVHFNAAGDQQLAENMFRALRPILEADLFRL